MNTATAQGSESGQGPDTARTPAEMAQLSLALRDAIIARDDDRILAVLAQGADPSVSFAPADSKRDWSAPFTPAWSLISEGAQERMSLVLGEDLKTIPLATNDGAGTGLNLLEMLAKRVGTPGIDILYSTRQLLERLAPDARGRGEGLWQIIDKLLTPRDHTDPGVWDATYACTLLGHSPIAPSPESCESLLARSVGGVSGSNPFVWMLAINDRDAQGLQVMLDAGLSPNAVICGVPLLHHLAACDHQRAIEKLIDAGVDASACYDASAIIASCEDAYRDKGLSGDYTAASLAEFRGAHGAAQMIHSHLARERIDSVLQRSARKHSLDA
jgi:hypothetical protein